MVSRTASPREYEEKADTKSRRVLVVEDENRRLAGITDRLKKRRDLEIAYATGTDQAIQELANSPFDVVVSAMRTTASATLFQKIKDRYPDIARITVTNQGEAIFTALQVSHQVLSNPCDIEHLMNVINRASRLRGLLSDE